MVAGGPCGEVDRLCAPSSPTGGGHPKADGPRKLRRGTGQGVGLSPDRSCLLMLWVRETPLPIRKLGANSESSGRHKKGLSPGPDTTLSSTVGPFAFQNLGY